ncbi:ankyrin repeat domain-containing protein [Helicobacter jaachi]|uniref:Ankyrin repeat domain-containing protein n=2 Tax=Helicobacter jaachi TaxID=1677920 RepID=A0A4U8T9E6_9HELI|nr:ankyrin repeat domain-containing protein [Helicobacter jaachi]
MDIETTQKLEELCRYAFECARHDNASDLERLLNYGLNVNLTNEKGDTLLMLAAYNGNVNATRILLKRGADIERLNDKRLSVLSGACFKGYDEIVKMLLEHDADIHAGRLSALNCALMFRRKKILTLLLTHNAAPLSLWQRICARLYGVRSLIVRA